MACVAIEEHLLLFCLASRRKLRLLPAGAIRGLIPWALLDVGCCQGPRRAVSTWSLVAVRLRSGS